MPSLASPAASPRECHTASDATRRAAWRSPSWVDQAPAKSPRAEVRQDAWAASRASGASWSSNLSLVIVFQIDVDGIAFRPAECDPPISAGIDRIAASVSADERMKAEARQVHVLRPRCVIECAQNVDDPSRILHAEPATVPRREEAFQGLVSERADHAAM